MQQHTVTAVTTYMEWLRFLLLAFVGLPIIAAGLISLYGFAVWLGQIFFWGPPG